VATASGLWTIGAAVYLSLMGPQGMKEIGETIISNARYARKLLGAINGVNVQFNTDSFKEFVINFDGTGKSVSKINKSLLERKIFGGKDLSGEFPEFGNSALYCITEIHTREDIERMAEAVEEVIK
jgi:glycine dehydrogenase subunit 1